MLHISQLTEDNISLFRLNNNAVSNETCGIKSREF